MVEALERWLDDPMVKPHQSFPSFVIWALRMMRTIIFQEKEIAPKQVVYKISPTHTSYRKFSKKTRTREVVPVPLDKLIPWTSLIEPWRRTQDNPMEGTVIYFSENRWITFSCGVRVGSNNRACCHPYTHLQM
jgi:hypothetical protein